MSFAEDMKALADEAVRKDKENPASIAKGIFTQVLMQVQASAANGSYTTRYDYAGAHWRAVNEALVPLLVAEGFQAEERGNGVAIRWDAPKKRVENELAVREV